MDKSKIKEIVTTRFTEYLDLNKQRKTPERFAILDYIYSTKGHFDVDTLIQSMEEINFRVSRATVYNTLQLLLDANLLVKHQFGANVSQFERTCGSENHDHLICTSCGKVKEYKHLDSFTATQQKRFKGFTVNYFSMYIYGICSKCKKEKLQLEKKKNGNQNKINTIKKK